MRPVAELSSGPLECGQFRLTTGTLAGHETPIQARSQKETPMKIRANKHAAQIEKVKRSNQSTNNQVENSEFSGCVGGFGRYRHYTRVGVKGDRSQ